MGVRELGVKEIAIVSGGLTDSASVTGFFNPYAGEQNNFSHMNYWSIFNEYSYYHDNGSEGGNSSAEPVLTEPVLTEEQKIDQLANNLATQIMAKPDWQTKEYVAVLYKLPDGTIVATAIYPGLTNGTASEATKLALLEAGGVANLGNIIGIIHNHLQTLVDEADNKVLASDINKMPSDADWRTAADLFDNRADFALYILGPDGELREYENSDRALWDTRNDPSYYNTHKGLYDNWLDSEQGVKP